VSLRRDGQLVESFTPPYHVPGAEVWKEFVELAVSETAFACAELLNSGKLAQFRGRRRRENGITLEVHTLLNQRLTMRRRDDSFNLVATYRENLPSGTEPDLRIRHGHWQPDKHFFCWECKCLRDPDRGSLAKKFNTDGVERFRVGHYCAACDDAGMLGFVIEGDLGRCIERVNHHLPEGERLQRTEGLAVPSGESTHSRVSGSRIRLTHLFLKL